MEKFKIITSSGVEKEVDGIFYLYNSKYFFAYTEKELDENEYVVFNLVQVGKEIKNTSDGPIDTGYMVGMEILDEEEWKNVQKSITKIVEDKRNDIQSDEIQYLPRNMLSTLKIMSSKTFRLAKNVVEQVFKLNISNETSIVDEMLQNDEVSMSIQVEPQISSQIQSTISLDQQKSPLQISDVGIAVDDNSQQSNNVSSNVISSDTLTNDSFISAPKNVIEDNLAIIEQSDVIIDYRARFFEEQEKNQQLEEQIKILTEKLENIKLLIG